MSPSESLLESIYSRAWWSFDLGAARPCDGTYQLYPYDSIPALDENALDGTFSWLGARTSTDAASPAVRALAAALELKGAGLSRAFVRFMSDESLQGKIPSCTACEWDLSVTPVPTRLDPAASTVRFLRDQQDCLFWYLIAGGADDGAVVCSPIPFDDANLTVSDAEVKANTWIVAPSFEHFVYRFWIENALWFLLSEGRAPANDAQRAYLEHYRPN